MEIMKETNMKRKSTLILMLAGVLTAGILQIARTEDTSAPSSSYEAEKAKALANPYANDLGPDKLSADVLASYPAEVKEGYELLQGHCSRCHSPARPLNSQFFEPSGKGPEKDAKIEALKASNPELFKDKNVYQAEGHVWERYVKRMMSKPGCGITPEQGKKIWGFLVYDSNQRKGGAKASAWVAHRKDLLAQFKAKNPKRYDELYSGK
jgi:hypothetical protein